MKIPKDKRILNVVKKTLRESSKMIKKAREEARKKYPKLLKDYENTERIQ